MRWHLAARTAAISLCCRLGRALIGFGTCWFPGPPAPVPHEQDPGPGHPERLCPELPPSATELALWRQLGHRGRA
ncbi:DUF6059 family protein [Kitasatospora sp. NPDC059673]|uniref:DUF6059 family protein n=1 Tax=Kitasatospora sp. NPDC059673 TaxID=3346901 RepID=UPI0036A0872A